jgi:putative tryptophan/tyrosine transport system substrate-binding protein
VAGRWAGQSRRPFRARSTGSRATLRAGLRDLGYVEDRNVTLALRFAGGVPARLPELAAELVALKPDVILAGSIGGIVAARNATRTIPLIMMVISEDPVALGLINSITRPGGNITGIWMFADDSLVGKRLEFVKHVVPGLVRIGVIINPDDPSDAIVLKRLPAAARALGMDFGVFEARAPAEFETVFTTSARDGMQGCLLVKVLCSILTKPKSRRWRRASACRQSTVSVNSRRRAA